MSGSLTIAAALLAVNGAIGAVDTLWYHEWRGRLPLQGGGVRTELALHAGRDAIYAVVYGTVGWVAWQGAWALVFAALLATELVITFCDFAVEARVRDVSAGERILHTSMGIVYGAMLASLLPLLVDQAHQPTGLARVADGPPRWLVLVLVAFAAGIVGSGLRDAHAAVSGPSRAYWPSRARRSRAILVPTATGSSPI